MTKMRLLEIGTALVLAACGGATTTTTSTTTTTATTSTAGGEARTESHPIRTTTPIPVPQPALSREQMSPELQRVWELVEVAVAIRPPEPPADHSTEGVNAWSQGPFAAWLNQRAAASSEAQDALMPLEEAPAHERGVAAGLLGYLYETTCADVRGAPIPDPIASDAELLRVYDSAMHEALLPYARTSVQAYRFCSAAFSETNDIAWTRWSEYCGDRAIDVAEVFAIEIEPGAPAATSP